MEYLQQQPFEFVQFLDFFNTNLDDPEVTNYIQTYSDFCNFREHKCSGVSVEKAFIKWRMSKNTPTPLVKIEDEPETKKWIMSQDKALPQNEIKPITMIEPCNPTSTITTATPEHMTYKQSKDMG